MNISPQEAASALKDIEASQKAMRRALGAHRGHLYMWLWGALWTVTALINGFGPASWGPASGWICIGGVVATFLIAFVQGRQVRSPLDKRFLSVIATLLVFDYGVWPLALNPPHTPRSLFAFGTLIWAQIYIVGGIWFGSYLLQTGIILTLIIVAGLFLPAVAFWCACALAGLVLIGTGIVVRRYWA
jgi:hypothetical protein